jgi:hypothetical protein
MRASRRPAPSWETEARRAGPPTGEAETAGDRESRRKDWGWGLGATERGLRTLGWGQRETARGGDDRRRTRIVGRIWFFFFVAL